MDNCLLRFGSLSLVGFLKLR